MQGHKNQPVSLQKGGAAHRAAAGQCSRRGEAGAGPERRLRPVARSSVAPALSLHPLRTSAPDTVPVPGLSPAGTLLSRPHGRFLFRLRHLFSPDCSSPFPPPVTLPRSAPLRSPHNSSPDILVVLICVLPSPGRTSPGCPGLFPPPSSPGRPVPIPVFFAPGQTCSVPLTTLPGPVIPSPPGAAGSLIPGKVYP